jgi:hypothetical protein
MAGKAAEVVWVSIPAAAFILGVGTTAIKHLIETGRLTSRTVPGTFTRVLRSEVEALAEAYTSPAMAEAS